MVSKTFAGIPRWIAQAAAGVALVAGLSIAVGEFSTPSTVLTAQAPNGVKGEGCEPGFTGSAAAGCTDVNECTVSNGGCHRLTACQNTAGFAHVRRLPQGLRRRRLRRLLRRQRMRQPGLQRPPALGRRRCARPGGDDIRRRQRGGNGIGRRGRDLHGYREGQRRRHPSRELPAGVGLDVQGGQDGRRLLGVQQAGQDWARCPRCHGYGQLTSLQIED